MRRNGIGSTFWGSFHQFLCVWALSCPRAEPGCWAQAWDQFETQYLCLSWAAAEPLLPPATMRQMWNSTKILHFLHLKEMGNSEKCISTKLTLFSFHDLFSKQRIRNFCCADLNKSTIWRRAKWFCETLRLPKMWWDSCGWARISPIFLPTNNPDVATSVLMVSWRPGGSRQPTVWFVCLWFVGLLGSTLVHTETEMLRHSLQDFLSILHLVYWFKKKLVWIVEH